MVVQIPTQRSLVGADPDPNAPSVLFGNTNHVKESELAYLFGKIKYEENLIDSIYETDKEKLLSLQLHYRLPSYLPLLSRTFKSPDDEEDTRSSQEFNGAKATDQTECHKCSRKAYNDFEAKYNKVKDKLVLLSSIASSPKSSSGKNKGLIAETYEWDEEEVSFDEYEAIKVKALMALANEGRVSVSKEVPVMVNGSRSLYERNNLLSKHRDLVKELNTCKEHLLILNQAKLDLLTTQHVNTEILKEN
ncbi:hypothetical protein Tco_0731227 [Tanacetum coccineum]